MQLGHEEGVVVVIPTPTSTSRTPTTTTPQPGTGTLLVRKVCVTFQGAGCDPNFHFPIQVTGNHPQPSTFVLTPDSSQLVTLGPGTYTITEGQPPGVLYRCYIPQVNVSNLAYSLRLAL